MAERPLLILPKPIATANRTRQARGNSPIPLSAYRQQQRLGQRLLELEAAFNNKRLTLQTTAAGLVPEDVLVLETAGTVEEFFRAAAKIQGLEFLNEFDEDDIPPDDDFFVDDEGTRKSYRGRVYLMFANQVAFQQLLNLWGMWQRGEDFQHGLTRWRKVFELLRTIRPWSINDRLEETGVLEDWQNRLTQNQDRLPCEIELWFRANDQQRTLAANKVRTAVEELGGEVVAEAAISDIHYHALAVYLPISTIQLLLDSESRGTVALVQAEQIQFFRSSGQMAGRITVDETLALGELPDVPIPGKNVEPVVALLDGLPLQSHQALAGRIVVDDPDNYERDYEARFRIHGTAMASLIIWGDLHTRGEAIPQPLYVRPVMQPSPQPAWVGSPPEERVSESLLIVDLIHRSVRRMFEGEGGQPATAPNVALINLSIGIADRPFEGTMSPLARLLDWLAWKYNVLFVVSAGNHVHPLSLAQPWSQLSTASEVEIQSSIIKAVAIDARNRRLLSPAEAMNVLTIGALHQDGDQTSLRPNWIDPANRGFPSPINAQGLGYKRSVKPDILAPGGRVAFVRPMLSAETQLSLPRISSYAPGQLVAVPGPTSGDTSATAPNRGTSNAAALVTRAGAFIVPMLSELRLLEGGDVIDNVADAIWLKALLVHSARWGELGDAYQELLKSADSSSKLAEYLTRFLGYGSVDPNTIYECTQTRVTAITGGSVTTKSGAEHRIPLPPSLSGWRGYRCLAVTLAWMTPIHPTNHRWRRAHLWFSSPESKLTIGSDKHLKRRGSNWQAVQRGTVQHEVFDGKDAAVFTDGDEIVIHVSCREDAKVLTSPVPYSLAVTLEVDDSLQTDIYSEIRDRIINKVRVASGRNESR